MNKAFFSALIAAVVLAVVLLVGRDGVSYIQQTAAVVTATLVSLTNESRADKNLYGLQESDALTRAAQAKADDMASKGYFSHSSPYGKLFWEWIREAGYGYSYAGENLAISFSDSEEIIDAWLDSPSHRANVLSTNFSEIGVATATGTYKGRPTTFVVQMFGTPINGTAPRIQRELDMNNEAPFVIQSR
jgi:uncharacterized protein YkwD